MGRTRRRTQERAKEQVFLLAAPVKVSTLAPFLGATGTVDPDAVPLFAVGWGHSPSQVVASGAGAAAAAAAGAGAATGADSGWGDAGWGDSGWGVGSGHSPSQVSGSGAGSGAGVGFGAGVTGGGRTGGEVQVVMVLVMGVGPQLLQVATVVM